MSRCCCAGGRQERRWAMRQGRPRWVRLHEPPPPLGLCALARPCVLFVGPCATRAGPPQRLGKIHTYTYVSPPRALNTTDHVSLMHLPTSHTSTYPPLTPPSFAGLCGGPAQGAGEQGGGCRAGPHAARAPAGCTRGGCRGRGARGGDRGRRAWGGGRGCADAGGWGGMRGFIAAPWDGCLVARMEGAVTN